MILSLYFGEKKVKKNSGIKVFIFKMFNCQTIND